MVHLAASELVIDEAVSFAPLSIRLPNSSKLR